MLVNVRQFAARDAYKAWPVAQIAASFDEEAAAALLARQALFR